MTRAIGQQKEKDQVLSKIIDLVSQNRTTTKNRTNFFSIFFSGGYNKIFIKNKILYNNIIRNYIVLALLFFILDKLLSLLL